jgi:hypothetical protein
LKHDVLLVICLSFALAVFMLPFYEVTICGSTL